MKKKSAVSTSILVLRKAYIEGVSAQVANIEYGEEFTWKEKSALPEYLHEHFDHCVKEYGTGPFTLLGMYYLRELFHTLFVFSIEGGKQGVVDSVLTRKLE